MPEVAELTGRQLDAAVAERVMGETVLHDWPCGQTPDGYEGVHFLTEAETLSLQLVDREDYPDRGPVTPVAWPPEHCDWMHEDFAERYHCLVAPVAFYSTDIAAAWQVVEKLAELGHEVQIDFNDGDEYVKVDIGMWFGGDGMKAPEAVCRAALRVIDAP